jgi:hypothetical protein
MRQATLLKTQPDPSADNYYCSFCLKAAFEVQKLVAGQGGIFICNECVTVCNDYIASGSSERSGLRSIEETPTDRLLALLKPIEDTVAGKSNQLQTVVETLRGRKVSWAAIGNSLGISRQSAWERFSDAETE